MTYPQVRRLPLSPLAVWTIYSPGHRHYPPGSFQIRYEILRVHPAAAHLRAEQGPAPLSMGLWPKQST